MTSAPDFAALYAAHIRDAGFRDDADQRAVLPRFQRILDHLAAPQPDPVPEKRGLRSLFKRAAPSAPTASTAPRGLYLWGGVGVGKSMLMDLFHDAAPTDAKRRVHFHAFMQEVQDRLHEVRKTGVDDAIKPVADEIADTLRLLCFDEMQITDIADAMIVGRLFQRLWDRGVMVVTTSNRVPGELYKNGLNRKLFEPFIALIEERLVVHHLASGRDYRQNRLAGQTRYFTPLGAEATAGMDALWTRLAEGDTPGPLHLTVKGRDLTLPGFANGVARAGFEQLCGQALGARDYLALTEEIEMLMIDDVPQLTRDTHDRAKRFVTLIDALYEARTGLALSAAAEPEALYPDGEGAFEFQRTASRLREMMSADWAAP